MAGLDYYTEPCRTRRLMKKETVGQNEAQGDTEELPPVVADAPTAGKPESKEKQGEAT